MSKALKAADLAAILRATAAGWASHADEARQLDAAIGDGDMGVTLELGSRVLADYCESVRENDIGTMLMHCGMRLNKACPSTFGTLLASAFMEAGKTVAGRTEIEISELATLGTAAIDGITKRGKAQAGEKTMLDSLIPAVDAFRQTLAQSGDAGDAARAVEAAVAAARDGMAATADMKAKYSRASYRPDGGIGVRDPGATAMYYLIEGFGLNLGPYL